MTQRTLQRLFAEYVGVSPGWVLRRGRLHAAAERVIHLAASGPEESLAAVAAEFGYADQAHFSRDFRRVLGTAPGDWAIGPGPSCALPAAGSAAVVSSTTQAAPR